MNNTFNHSVSLLHGSIKDFHEVRVVGDISSKAGWLNDFGIVSKFGLVHTDNYTGEPCDEFIQKPEKQSQDYIHEIVEIDIPKIKDKLLGIKNSNKKVYIAMPWANQQLEELISELGMKNQIALGSPCDFNQNIRVENKIVFMQLCEELREKLSANIIPTKLVENESYTEILSYFGIESGYPIFVQTGLSAGGDGTRKIKDECGRDKLRKQLHKQISSGQVKVSLGIVGGKDKEGYLPPYSSNFQACNIPDGKGGIKVLLEPGSLKPTGIPSLGIPDNPTGLGNDWSMPQPQHITSMGTKIFESLGELLRERFSYIGLWGPDCIIGDKGDGNKTIFCNEINPREQGTSVQQILNAKLNDRVPLHILHTLLKMSSVSDVAKNSLYELLNLVDDNFNINAMNSKGGFYIKLMQPFGKVSKVIKDISGIYKVNFNDYSIESSDLCISESDLMIHNN